MQNNPNYLKYNAANGATKILERGFNESSFSKNFSRIKFGHPEGYLSAFSNLYKEIASKINSKNIKKRFYFPTAYEGLLTAKFIDGCVKSSKKKKMGIFLNDKILCNWIIKVGKIHCESLFKLKKNFS